MKKQNLMSAMTLILLIVLTTFSSGCETIENIEPVIQVKLDLPIEAQLNKPYFEPTYEIGEDMKRVLTGFFLAKADYIILESNIIEYRRYIGELEAQIEYYRGTNSDEYLYCSNPSDSSHSSHSRNSSNCFYENTKEQCRETQ